VCAALLAPGCERTLSRAQGVNVRRAGALGNAVCADHDAVLFAGQTAAMVHQEAA